MSAAPIKAASFHAGELRAHRLARMETPQAAIRERMPEQHRAFFSLLPYAFLSTADDKGGPHATIITGSPGFISSPADDALLIAGEAQWLDETPDFLRAGKQVGMLGIDLATRRRNRANGVIAEVDGNGWHLHLAQSFGNCPKYIQLRELAGTADTDVNRTRHSQQLVALDDHAGRMIAAADTFFVASNAATAEGGPDMSHKGGRPGFIRLDDDMLTIPDFTGNRYFNTLGNLLLDPRAALLFIDFSNGDVLQLKGVVEILWETREMTQLEGAERLWRFRIEAASRITGALPLRWKLIEMAPTTERTGTWVSTAPGELT